MTNLEAKDKWEALRKLADFYGRTHKVSASARKAIYKSVVDREQEQSTAIGRGAALPHGHVEKGSAIRGVLGICPDGVDFDAPDGEPVRLIVLIVTPKEHEQRHLEVLASLNTMLADPVARTRLVAAPNANEAWEVLESEETRDYNYFLDMEEGEGSET